MRKAKCINIDPRYVFVSSTRLSFHPIKPIGFVGIIAPLFCSVKPYNEKNRNYFDFYSVALDNAIEMPYNNNILTT